MKIPKTYRKLIARRFSDDFASAAEIVEVPLEKPAPGEILIRNRYAGINGGFDTLVCQGKTAYINLTPPFDLGVEAIGEVVAIGEGVKNFQTGDAVVTTARGGGYREYQTVNEVNAIQVRQAIPEILTLMPTGISALVALERAGEMKSGEVVLITAAAGGTGHIAVQLAKLAGNHVIGTCGSPEKGELLTQLGCDRVINYRSENLDSVLANEYPEGVNLVFDCVGKEVFDTCVRHLAIRGRSVSVGFIAEYGKAPEEVTRPRIYHELFWKGASVRGFLMPLYREYEAGARDRLLDLFYGDRLKVLVDPASFQGIESIPDAVRYLLDGRNAGKVVARF